jgi:hypothetical protein
MIAGADFPRLTPGNHRVTSPRSPDYNCIAWAAGDTAHWWEPGTYWPGGPAAGYALADLEALFRAMGYEVCPGDRPEAGWEKVALYANDAFYTHAARQLASGWWTSKLGGSEDIEHDSPDAVAGGVYGEVARILRRSVTAP